MNPSGPLLASLFIAHAACGGGHREPTAGGSPQSNDWRSTPPAPAEIRPPRLPELREGLLSNGMRILVASRPGSSRVAMAAALHHEPTLQQAAIAAAAKQLVIGLPELKSVLTDHGATTAPDVPNQVFLVTTQADSTAAIARTLARSLWEPSFNDERLAHAIRTANQWLAWKQTNTFARAIALLRDQLLPVGASAPTKAALEEITTADVSTYLRIAMSSCHTRIIIVGDLTFSRATAIAESTFGSLPLTVGCSSRATQGGGISTTEAVIATDGAGQSAQVTVGCRGPSRGSREALALEVAIRALRTRAYKTLREEEGMIYGLYTDTRDAGAGGWGLISMGTTSKHAAFVAEWLRLELHALATDETPAEDIARAKTSLRTTHLLTVASTKKLAVSIAEDLLAGAPPGQPRTTLEQLAGITQVDIHNALSECTLDASRGAIVLHGQ